MVWAASSRELICGFATGSCVAGGLRGRGVLDDGGKKDASSMRPTNTFENSCGNKFAVLPFWCQAVTAKMMVFSFHTPPVFFVSIVPVLVLCLPLFLIYFARSLLHDEGWL